MNNQPAKNPELPVPSESSQGPEPAEPAPDSTPQPPVAAKPGDNGSDPHCQLSVVNSPLPAFPRSPGETPRAYSAFIAFFQLGHSRTLQAVADHLDEGLSSVKRWSTRFAWADRVQAFNAGVLQQQAEAEATARRQHAADWAKRENEFREQEWGAAQKLLVAAQCFLETFGEEELQKMNLAQVSRALNISSRVGRLALAGAGLPEKIEPAMSPIQIQLTEALNRLYGPKPSAPSDTAQQPNEII